MRHQLEAEYKEQLEQLWRDNAGLAARHEQFSAEHASAVERSREQAVRPGQARQGAADRRPDEDSGGRTKKAK